jgi:hypothetical protein
MVASCCFFILAKTEGPRFVRISTRTFLIGCQAHGDNGRLGRIRKSGLHVSERRQVDLPPGKTILFWFHGVLPSLLRCTHLMPGGERLPRDSTPHSSPLRSSESPFRMPSATLILRCRTTLLPCVHSQLGKTDGRESDNSLF